MLWLLTAAVVTASGECDLGDPVAPDAAAATAYAAVAQDELARGERELARLAMREAVRRDPTRAALQASWRTLCAPPSDGAMAEGLRWMKAGDCRRAITAFAAARPDPSAALLQGVCHYDLGEDTAARVALEDALRSPADAEVASLYLGLVALREGRTEEAQGALRLAAASRDPSTADAARTLARATRHSARLSLTVGVELGHDSNASVQPDRGTSVVVPDQLLALAAAAVVRPMGVSGPFLHASALYRNLRVTDDFDVLHGEAAAGWQWGRGLRFVRAQASYGHLRLGSDPYSHSYRGEISGAHAWGDLGVSASYGARYEQLLGGQYARYSGLQQEGTLFGQGWLGGTGVSLGYRVERTLTQAPEFTHTEHGPLAELRIGVGQRHRLVLASGFAWRPYDATSQFDQVLEASLEAELDVSEAWRVRLGASVERSFSNVAAFDYTRWFANVGFVGTFAPW